MKVIAQMQSKRVWLAVVCLIGLGVGAAWAEDAPARNWRVALGGTIVLKPIYSGSNELAGIPYPFIDAEYRTNYVNLFVFGDEVGVRLHQPGNQFSYLVLGAKNGQSRDNENEAVESLLKGTPSVKNLAQFFGGITLRTRVGEFSSRLYMLPVDAEYDEADRPDESYSALKASLDYLVGGNIDPKMFVFAGIGTNWMNDDYAAAYHGLLYPSAKFDVFDAQGGMNDVHGMFGAIYTFGAHVTGILKLSGAKLLGDAADSPLTKSAFQPDLTMVVSYAF